jgi:ATP-dependent Clp protease adaptor protein ClpS
LTGLGEARARRSPPTAVAESPGFDWLVQSNTAMAGADRQTSGEVLERTQQETKKPELYKVLLLNDDYTTMDFVVEILETVFHKPPAEAHRIMMMVHTQGKGLCGVYPFEVAETKVATVVDRARENGFPLRAAMEPE